MDIDLFFTTLQRASTPLLLLAVVAIVGIWAKRRMQRRSLMTDGLHPLENLPPLMAYDSDETGYWRRARYSGAAFVGGGCVIPALLTHTLTVFSPVVTVLLFAAAGLWFGFIWTVAMRTMGRLLMPGLYAGQERVVAPPPADLMASCQLPCHWVPRKAPVWGVLYLGEAGLLLVPLRRFRRHLPPAEVLPIDSVKLTLLTVKPNWGNPIARFLVPRPLRPIELSWNGGATCIFVPQPEETIKRLRDRLNTLRRVVG